MWWLIKSNDDDNDKSETNSSNKENYETSNDSNDKVKGKVINSKITFEKLYNILKNSKDKITIKII